MAILSAGQSVQINIGEDSGIWANCTGIGAASFEFNKPAQIPLTIEYKRIGFYGIPVTVTLSCASGQIEYLYNQPMYIQLKAIQGGDQDNSSPLDIKLNVNGLQSGGVPFDAILLKGMQKTTGAPNGYGDLSSAIRDPYRNVGCVKIGGALASSGVSNRTTAATFLLRARPARMRVHLLNANTTPITGVAASVAPSQNQNLWYEPSGGVSAFKLLNLSSSTIPAASSGGGTANAIPSEVVSSWFNPNALDRNDGGSGFIFMIRVYCDASNNGARMHLGGTVATSDFSKYEARCGFGAAAGNFTTTSGVITEDGTSCPAFYLEVEYETPVASVAIVGDSIMQGANADPSANSAAYGAAFQALKRIAATGKSVQLYNAGWSGASTNGGTGGQLPDNIVGYLGQFQSWISSGARPTIAAFCPWSVNNSSPYLSSQLNSVRQSIGVFIALCESQKIFPALVTPAPRNGITEADEAVRRQVVDYVKSYCSQTGTTLIDRDGVYTDYSVPTGGYKLPEWCVDGIHPTQSGHFAESFEWESVLNTIV